MTPVQEKPVMKSATVLATGGLGPKLRIVSRAWTSWSNLIGTNKRRLIFCCFGLQEMINYPNPSPNIFFERPRLSNDPNSNIRCHGY